jgi:LemA protein
MPIILIILIALVIAGIMIYNGLIQKKNAVENAFSSIDVMLKKRYDLLPSLVENVKQYMHYEKDTLEKVVSLRNQAIAGNASAEDKVQIDNQISSFMRGVMVNVENYPDLKASQNFLQLQGSWNEAEEQISAARRSYNAAVNDYNNGVEMFPSSIFAGMMKLQKKGYFEASEQDRASLDAKKLWN